MNDNNRNINSGLFVLLLMIIFFSLLQREKDTHNEKNQSVISYTANSNSQAIIVPEISSPGTDIFWIKGLNTKIDFLDYDSSKELVLNKLISSYYTSLQVGFYSNNPIIGLILPQKIPQQGNDDYLSLI